MKVVLCVGCFDPLHYGHVLHLQQARALGDKLVVALTSDDRMRTEKGDGRPFFSWSKRAVMLSALRVVDEVVSHSGPVDVRGRDSAKPLAVVIREVRPAIYCKGIDYAGRSLSEADAIARVGADVVITETEKWSAGDVIRLVRGGLAEWALTGSDR